MALLLPLPLSLSLSSAPQSEADRAWRVGRLQYTFDRATVAMELPRRQPDDGLAGA